MKMRKLVLSLFCFILAASLVATANTLQTSIRMKTAKQSPFEVFSTAVALTKPRIRIFVDGFCFELRDEAYRKIGPDSEMLHFIAGIVRKYNAYLSPDNNVSCVYIFNPGEIKNTYAKIASTQAIGYSYEAFTFMSYSPVTQKRHLLQLTLHELGHYFYDEPKGRALWPKLDSIYSRASDFQVKFKLFIEPKDEFFKIFTDWQYEHISDKSCGHPYDNAGELFSSAFMIMVIYPDELEERIFKATPPIRNLAIELRNEIQPIVSSTPHKFLFLSPAEERIYYAPVLIKK